MQHNDGVEDKVVNRLKNARSFPECLHLFFFYKKCAVLDLFLWVLFQCRVSLSCVVSKENVDACNGVNSKWCYHSYDKQRASIKSALQLLLSLCKKLLTVLHDYG